MNASTLADPARPTLRIRGTEYPILLPTVSDPRLHLAFVIISFQVLGQVAFGFQLSIAQILVSLADMRGDRVRDHLSPATRDHVAGERAPDRERCRLRPPRAGHRARRLVEPERLVDLRRHGRGIASLEARDPDSRTSRLQPVELRTRALLRAARLPRTPIRSRFWWGPMSPWMMLALAIILVGAFAILSRLHLLAIAVTFWITFAIGIGVIAAAGHEMTARWHLGPITGFEFWRVVVLSPEVMVFLFFMITDPKTTPLGRVGRRVYAVSVALLAVLLIAPQTTEFWTKVSLLGALWIVCAGRPVVAALAPRMRPSFAQPRRRRWASWRSREWRRSRASSCSPGSRPVPRRPSRAPRRRTWAPCRRSPCFRRRAWRRRSTRSCARQMTADLVSDLRIEADALARRDKDRAAEAAGGKRLQGFWQQISSAGTSAIIVPQRHVDRVQLNLEPAVGQDPPIVVATMTGTERLVTFAGTPAAVVLPRQQDAVHAHARAPARRRALRHRRLARAARPRRSHPAPRRSSSPRASAVRGSQNVAAAVGIDFQQNAIRPSARRVDVTAMMGGGVCWVDIDNDGWLDLFAVNSYSDSDYALLGGSTEARPEADSSTTPGTFTDVSRTSGADVQIRGNGCVAGGSQRRRLHRPLRHRGRVRRAALERRQRALHGGRPRRRDHRVGLAYRRHRRRRERRRPPRRLRRRLRRCQRAGHHRVRLPEQLRRRPRPALPQRGERPERTRPVPGDRREAADRHGLARARPRRRVHRRERRRSPRPLRRERRQPEPALPQHAVARRREGRSARSRLPTRGAGTPRQASPTRTPAWASPPPTTAATGAPTSSSPTRTSSCTPSSAACPDGRQPLFTDARSDIAPAFDTSLAGWGVSWVDLDNDGEPRSRARERRHPGGTARRRARSRSRPSRT